MAVPGHFPLAVCDSCGFYTSFSVLDIVVFVISGEFVDRCHTELTVHISLLFSESSMLDVCIDYLR